MKRAYSYRKHLAEEGIVGLLRRCLYMSCRIILWSQSTRMLEFKHPMPGRKETSVIEPLKKNIWTWQVSACRWFFLGWLAISVKPVCILIRSWLQAFKFAVKAINFEFEGVSIHQHINQINFESEDVQSSTMHVHRTYGPKKSMAFNGNSC